MDFKNSDITNGPAIDLTGADAAATLEAAAILAVAVQSANILPLTADGQLVLPAGVGLDDIKVVGRDLIIQMPDGTQMIVPDGAIFVPQIVVEGVAVPALNIAALLIGQEPQPAAGRLQSSGGNFADAVGDIGDPFGLGDLLPPTQLAFPGPEEREIIPGLIDRDPDVVIQDGGPASRDVVDNVSEVGLPGTRTNGNVESPGSSTGNGADSTTGTIFVTSPDGIASITINGVVVTGTAGQQIVTARGVLTLGALSNGQIGYTYRLTDNTSGDTTTDIFTVAVTDPDGDVANARLTINIADDVPTARNDTDSVPAGIYSGQTGNVITGIGTTSGNAGADTQGADGAVLSGIRAGTGSGTFAGAGTTINGQYGTLTISANGSYTYTRNAGTPGGVNDVFTYQLTDGDGDASTATLTISIADSPVTITSVPTAGAGTVVDEAGLPARGTEPPGSNAAAPSESTSGTISFTAPDGVASVSINGVTITGAGQVIAVPTGTLLITGYNLATGTLTYTFTLTDNTSGDATTQVFSITVTDTDGDTDTKPFTIRIIDDTPTAVADTDSIAAGNYGPATGNVISDVEGDGGKDVQGADGVLVTNVAGAGGSGGAGTAVNGLYGVLTVNADGSYSYVRNAGSPGGVSDVFTYTITDADGDASSATLTIAIADSPVTLDLPVKGAAGTLVDEAGLPAGSNAAADSEKTTGTIAYAAADGPASVTIDGVAVTAVGQIFTGSFGTLKITSIANGVVGYEYLLTTNTSGDATFDDFAIVVTDQDGDSSSGTLVIDIIDDVPTARADVDSVTEDDFGGESESVSADGNVITGVGGGDANDTDGVADTKGADGATVTAVAFGAVAGTVNGTTDGAYGTLTLNADGSYSYVLNNFDPRVQGLDSDDSLTEVFTYTLTDGDGDARTTTLTITINGSDDGITINGLNIQGPDLIVDDDDLPAGSDPVKEPLTQTGSFTINGVDGISSIKIEGVEAFVGQTFTTAYGTFTITSIVTNTTAGGDPTSITVNYSYTLNDNVPHPVGGGENTITEVFDVDVTDTDGSTESGTVKVLIIDDVPDANNDSAGPVAENAAVTVNVIANDIQGADGVNLTTGVALVGGSLTGTGTLVYNADGTFTYTPAAGEEGLVTFNYQITDGDGDTDIATVTIDLGKDSTPTLRASDGQADERALPDGSNPGSTAETTTGTIAIGTGSDGIGSLVINGVNVTAGGVVVGAYGTLTVTLSAGVYSYSYTLTDNTTDHPTNPTTGTSEGIFDDFNIVLTDSDGDVANDTITIDILDDGPTARNDTVNQDVENTAITFDVFGNDTYGADGVDIDNNPGVAVTFTQPATGTVSYDPATGLFTFTPVAGQLGTVTYTYTIIDGDGDPSTATVTINLKADSVPTVRVTDVTVNEDGLPARAGEPEGTSFGSNSHIGTGGFSINTGGDTLQKLELRDALGNWVDVTAGGVVNGANGTLVVSVLAGVYTYTYTLTDNLENHPDFVTIDGDGISDAADSLAGEAFDVRVTDSDNSVSAIDTLNVTVLDDAPSAANDVAAQTAENAAFTIAVFGNDLFGADGVATSSPGKVTFTQATYGVVSYDPATGLFTYTPNAGAGSLSTTDSFTYTIIDGDGDPSTATVTLTLQPDSTPTLSVTDITVDEKGLPNGSGELANPALNTDNSETGAGAFSISTGNDGIQAVEVQNKFGVWINVTAATVGVPVVVQGNNGTLTVTSNGAGSYSYSYTLTNNLLTHDDILIDGDSDRGTADQKPGDAFAVRVTDTDGDTTTVTAATTINVTVNDDGPTANNDAVGLTEGGPSFVTFDVDTNDVAGADGTASRVFTSLTGTYGNIVLNVDGTQTYTLTAAGQLAIDALPPGVTLTDTFSYTLTDGDNDSDPAQLVITLTGSDDPVLITNLTSKLNGGDASVDEDDLPAGSDTTKESLTTTGNFNISAPDGVASLTIHGVLVVSNGIFTSPAPIVTPLGNTLTITAYNPATGLVSYSYTLNGAETHANAAGENDLFEDFAVVLTDADPVNPDVANSTLSIRIVDDVPTARDDTDSVTEGLNNVADGNVFVGGSGTDVNATDGVADTIGADGPGSVTNARVGAEGAGGALTAVTVAGVVISGTYGNLLIKADGSYTYTLKTASIPAGVTSEVFTYEITDADGDKDLAQLTISLVQDARVPDVTGSTAIVYEDGLADGIQHGATSETAIGTFTVNASGENYTLTLDGDVNPAQTIAAVGQTVVTSKGVLTITSISAPVAGVVTYGYSYTLSAARTHTGQGEVNPLSDTITMTVTDATGDIDSTPGSIVISIVDDVPIITAFTSPMFILNSGAVASTGTFAFAIGGDGPVPVNDAIQSVTFAGTVNGVAVGTPTITPISENANSAVFGFSFTYATGAASTATAVGVLTFDKVNGQYTVDLENPIQGFSIAGTSGGTLFQGYELNSAITDGSQPDVAVTQIATGLFAQFTSLKEPGGGTGANNLNTVNYGQDGTPANDGNGLAFTNGELFNQEASWVSASNAANGVGGDTVGGGEVLDFNLYATNPQGFVGGAPTANASTMYLKFDGIGDAEDFIIILKLFNTLTNEYTTKALMVQNSDIQKGPGSGPGVFAGITLDNNDGLIVIESNDYNSGLENFVIVGAQIAGSDEGIVGTAINFNNATGAGGASTGTQAFSTDVNGNPMKISDIGFIVNSTTAQTAQLNFGVTIQDRDGDTATQALVVNIGSTPPAAPLAPLSDAESALPGDGTLFSLDQELEQTVTNTAVAATSRVSGTQMTAVEAASPSSASLALSGKTVEQARNSTNVAATVIAASLVGLAVTPNAAAAPTPEDARLDMLPDMETATPDHVSLTSDTEAGVVVNQPETATETEFTRISGDEGSNLQAVDDSDMPAGVIAQPVAEISDSLNGGADTVSISDIVPTAAPMGGDVVMHDILDMAAAGLAAASNDNIAKLAIEDVVNEAMPDTMVDRLVEAFETDAGPPAIGGDAGADSSGYLVELINQSVSNSSDLATIHVDPFGSQLHDMTSTNNG